MYNTQQQFVPNNNQQSNVVIPIQPQQQNMNNNIYQQNTQQQYYYNQQQPNITNTGSTLVSKLNSLYNTIVDSSSDHISQLMNKLTPIISKEYADLIKNIQSDPIVKSSMLPKEFRYMYQIVHINDYTIFLMCNKYVNDNYIQNNLNLVKQFGYTNFVNYLTTIKNNTNFIDNLRNELVESLNDLIEFNTSTSNNLRSVYDNFISITGFNNTLKNTQILKSIYNTSKVSIDKSVNITNIFMNIFELQINSIEILNTLEKNV